MKRVRSTFETALHRCREAEERKADVLQVLWTLGTVAAVILPEHYGMKAVSVVVSWFVLLVIWHHNSPDAVFHRAWKRAGKEMSEQ